MEGNVLIVGAGRIGSALAGIIRKGHMVEMWDIEPCMCTIRAPLGEMVKGADIIVLCVPSWGMREVVGQVAADVRRSTPVFSLAKGLEPDGTTMARLLADILPPAQPFGLIAGPLIAEDLKHGRGGVAVIASEEHTVADTFSHLVGSTMRISADRRINAVALCSVIKNVYAMALGIADGMGWGVNLKGALTARVISEMHEVAADLKIPDELISGLAGVGDLIATGFCESSRNRSVGADLAKGKVPERSEATASLEPLWILAGKGLHAPILSALRTVCAGGPAADEFSPLLSSD